MLSSNDIEKVTINDVRAGDIIIFNVYGVAHVAIYAPKPGKQGDLIQMSYGTTRSGAIKSTLSQQLKQQTGNILAFRSKHLDGSAIAEQAEFWLRQGIVFDEVRLANSLYEYSEDTVTPEHHIFEYLKYAARRNTMPIKVHQYPYNYTSLFTEFGLGMLFPDFEYSRPTTYLFSKLAKYGTDTMDRPKGMTCIVFALLCIAAVALKDEIQPVTPETGWAALKYSRMPNKSQSIFSTHLKEVKGEVDTVEFNGSGLQDLMTSEQINNFDIERLKKKMSPGLAALNPHQPAPEDFFQALIADQENWKFVGSVDKQVLKPFDREAFRVESEEIQQEIETNRAKFISDFGLGIFNRDPDKLRREYTVYQAL